jgi:hypothetical protein
MGRKLSLDEVPETRIGSGRCTRIVRGGAAAG